jgi:ClpP class serine protease
MRYPRIRAFVSSNLWAITTEALDGIYKALDLGLDPEDRDVFHKASEGALDLFDGQTTERPAFVRDGVGYLFVDGPIIPRDSAFEQSSGSTSIQTLSRELKALEDDPFVSRIRLIFDSPGGIITGVSDFGQQLANSSKPVTAFNVGQMASAAFWIAAGASKIYSVDTGLVGSLGVIFRPTKFDNQAIISSQSPNKWPNTDTEEGRRVLQTRADDLANVMLEFVAGQRNTTVDNVIANYGRGGVLIASKALEVGMIDGIATLADLVNGSLDTLENKPLAPTGTLRQQEIRMTETNSVPVADSVDVTHQIQEAVAKAVEAERERLAAIDAVRTEFAGEDACVREAVTKVVDGLKFKAGATVESVRTEALRAAFEAQKTRVTEIQGTRRELASILSEVPVKTDSEPNAVNQDRVKALRRGFLGGKND